MSTAKAVAGIIPGVMAVGLLGRTMSYLPTEMKVPAKAGTKELSGKAKPKPLKTVKMFTEIAVGVPLIGATAGMVAKL